MIKRIVFISFITIFSLVIRYYLVFFHHNNVVFAQSSPYATATPTPPNNFGNIYTHPSYGITGAGFPNPASNPRLTNLCGLDIALAMDISSSIDTSRDLPKEKEAITSFIRAFKNTNTNISLTTFYRYARLASSLTGNYDSIEVEINKIRHTSDGTNWEDALRVASGSLSGSKRPKLLVIFSDGDPTKPSGRSYAIKRAVQMANSIKSSGVRVLAVGINGAVNGSDGLKKMLLISGLNQLRPVNNNLTINEVSMTDYISTSFDSMQGILNQFAQVACLNSRISPSPTLAPYFTPSPTPTLLPSATPTLSPSPTPSPTPRPTNIPWFKLKNTSFNNPGSAQRNNIIPPNVSKYDSEDTIESRLIVGEGGLVVTKQNLNIGVTNRYSGNNWFVQNYTSRDLLSNFSIYAGHLTQATNNYKTISNVSSIDINDNKKIYYLNRSLTIDATKLSQIDKKNLVLIVNGDVDFNLATGIFNPTNSIAIIAKTIKFYKTDSSLQVLSRARGIFIADAIRFGTGTNTPLKITGNLISLGDRVENSRKQTDTTKPSLFVVFDPKIYLDVVSAIGITVFDRS